MNTAVSHLIAMSILSMSLAVPALAQDVDAFPSRPIKVIVPVPAGAGIDVGGRLVSEAAEKHLGKPLVIENKPGAGERLAAALVAQSAPDGYTLLYSSKAPITIAQFLSQKPNYDPVRDLTPVAITISAPVFLVVRESFPAKTVQEFVAYAKANPGKITFGIQGVGNDLHAMLELLREHADVKITAIPYTGGAPAIVDMLAERLDAMFLVPVAIKEHLASGRLRALATLEPKRVASFPSIPTTTESGLPQVTTMSWFGFSAPAATPKPIITKLAAALTKTQEDKALVSKLDAMGYGLRVLESAAAEHVIADDRAKFSKIAPGGRLDRVN